MAQSTQRINGANRIVPTIPVTGMQTYRVLQPAETHYRKATCREIGCGGYTYGWRTFADERVDSGRERAQYIRAMSGRHFTEAKNSLGVTEFTFPPGQVCFNAANHKVSLERPALFLVQGGDFRARTHLMRRHANADDWRDDFGEHQERVKARFERG